MWRTFVYCMNCDKSVKIDDKVCPHCGITFKPDKD